MQWSQSKKTSHEKIERNDVYKIFLLWNLLDLSLSNHDQKDTENDSLLGVVKPAILWLACMSWLIDSPMEWWLYRWIIDWLIRRWHDEFFDWLVGWLKDTPVEHVYYLNEIKKLIINISERIQKIA